MIEYQSSKASLCVLMLRCLLTSDLGNFSRDKMKTMLNDIPTAVTSGLAELERADPIL